MTGTSIDGLDLAAISVAPNNQTQFLACASKEFPQSLCSALRQLAVSQQVSFSAYGTTDARLGQYIGQCTRDWIAELEASGITTKAEIVGIGSHGQTVHHAPNGEHPFTLQIGDPSRIAHLTELPVVADFRRADIAAGGQGAPLVPPFHQQIFAKPGTHRVICNVGGISNITDLPADQSVLRGFDTGPGNTLLDAWYAQHNTPATASTRIDVNGAWARSGQIDSNLLDRLLSDPFFTLPPPKSTGPEYFNLNWLRSKLDEQPPAAIQATLVDLTAVSIARALPGTAEELILCGGGRHNGYLVERINTHCDAQVSTCDALGIDGDGLEAAAFAWLAYRTFSGFTGNEPNVTGARTQQVLGNVTPAPISSAKPHSGGVLER